MIHRERQHPYSYEILDQVIGRGDAAEIGRRLGRSAKNINQWCRPPETPQELTHTGRFNPLDLLRTIIEYVKEIDGSLWRAFPIAKYIARLCGGFFTPWPDTLHNLDLEVVGHLQKNYKEFHDLIEAVRQAWENDGHINEREATRVEKEGEEAIAAIKAVMVWAREKAEERQTHGRKPTILGQR